MTGARFNPKYEIWSFLWKVVLHDWLKLLLWDVGFDFLQITRLAWLTREQDVLCPLCLGAEELIVYLFVHCSVARAVWFSW